MKQRRALSTALKRRTAVALAVVTISIMLGAASRGEPFMRISSLRLAFVRTPPADSRAPFAPFAWSGAIGARYQCSLDNRDPRGCTSPTGFLLLEAGRHVFSVSDGSVTIRYTWTVMGATPARLGSRVEVARLAPVGVHSSANPTRTAGGPWYSVQQLPGHDALALDVDENGDVVGLAHDGSYNYRGIVWRNGQARAVGSSAKIESIANQNLLAGTADLSSDSAHATLYRNGNSVDLGTLGGMFSRGTGVSPNGTVVGHSRTGGERDAVRAFIWKNGAMSDLFANTTSSTTWSPDDFSYANAINSRDQVVGTAYPLGAFFAHPYLRTPHRNRRPTVVDLAPGVVEGEALGIDDAGDIVGDVSADSVRAFVWKNGALSLLDPVDPAGGSIALGVNASGEVVGVQSDRTGGIAATLWHNGQAVVLDHLLTANSSASDGLAYADAINERGQIVALGSPWAGELKSFLLTPLTKVTALAIASSATSGTTVKASVQIDRAAPPGGVTVDLLAAPGGTKISSLPAWVTIPSGATRRAVSVALPRVKVRTRIRLLATLYGSTVQAAIIIAPQSASTRLRPWECPGLGSRC
ncbi:MAG: hypothetical protein QOE13_1979 [Gaiellaceae bacterium]|jgi:probable HAF family extracellular repeat protein|nr:hypothetical protein [Gaiellaceae bacterium]